MLRNIGHLALQVQYRKATADKKTSSAAQNAHLKLKEGVMIRDEIYELLNLSNQVPEEIVKKAFKRFAKHNHPDFFPGDPAKEERFKRVSQAYQSWKLIQGTVRHIRRLRTDTVAGQRTSEFQPWRFSCYA